jgi:hypothetical protein
MARQLNNGFRLKGQLRLPKKITATSQTCGSSRYSSYQNTADMASGRGVSKESTSYSQGPLVRAECAPFTYTLLMVFRHSPRVSIR